MPPRVKAVANYQNSRLALGQARADGYDDAILLSGEGKVTEGPGYAIFMLRGGRLITPPVTSGILESITRDSIMANVVVMMLVLVAAALTLRHMGLYPEWWHNTQLLLLITYMPGMGYLFTMLIVDEMDSGVNQALLVSPASATGVLWARVVLPTAFVLVYAFAFIYSARAIDLPFHQWLLPILTQSLNDADKEVRKLAVTVLGKAAGKQRQAVFPLLLKGLGDSQEEVRAAAAAALTGLGAVTGPEAAALAETFDLTRELTRFPRPARFVELQMELARALDREATALASRPVPAGLHATTAA